jgi:hypothetical protein
VCSSTCTWRRSLDDSSARSRQAAQLRVEIANAHAPLMLAHDRRALQSRTSELLAWGKTMLLVTSQSVRDPRAQVQPGRQDIRTYFSKATVATMAHTTATLTVTSPARPNVLLLVVQQRYQSARNRIVPQISAGFLTSTAPIKALG